MKRYKKSIPNPLAVAVLRIAKTRMAELASGSLLDWALAKYFFTKYGLNIDLPQRDIDSQIKDMAYTATDTATLGFLLAAGFAKESSARFLEGVSRCINQSVPSTGPSVHSDPKLLLGIVVSRNLLDEKKKAWVKEHLIPLVRGKNLRIALSSAYANSELDLKSSAKAIEDMLHNAEPKSADESALILLALTTCGSEFSDASRTDLDRVSKLAMLNLFDIDDKASDSFTLAAAIVVLTKMLQKSLENLQSTAVGRLVAKLRRLPVAAKREIKEEVKSRE